MIKGAILSEKVWLPDLPKEKTFDLHAVIGGISWQETEVASKRLSKTYLKQTWSISGVPGLQLSSSLQLVRYLVQTNSS